MEDDAKTAASIEMYLRHDGFRTELARSGPEALQKARDTAPELIVLDLMLPGLGGLEVCKAIRGASAVPIIMLTARSTEDDKLRCSPTSRSRSSRARRSATPTPAT